VGAWQIYRTHRLIGLDATSVRTEKRAAFFVGLLSPWNVGFWLAVIGSQQTQMTGVRQSLAIAAAVVFGALTWTVVICSAVKLGARVLPNRDGRSRPRRSLPRLWCGSQFG